MNKFKLKLLGVALALGFMFNSTSIATSQIIQNCDNSITISAEEISPYTSTIFSYKTGILNENYYGIKFELVSQGQVTVTVEIQKKILGVWCSYDNTETTKTLTNVSSYKLEIPYSLNQSGTYRCKYTLTGTVNGTTETLTSYSSTVSI